MCRYFRECPFCRNIGAMEDPVERGVYELVRVVQTLSRARTLEAVQQAVRRAARQLTGADGATFVLRDGDLCFYADEDAIAPLWKGQRFPMTACVSGWAMSHREAVLIEDIYEDPRVPVDVYRPTFVRSLAMVPIRREAPIGAIGAYWASRRTPSLDAMRLLQALADSTSVALENVALYHDLEERIAEHTRAEEELRRELEERRRAEERLRQIEEQLRQTQKMEAIGKLAGGVAHDFNNILTTILGLGELMRLDLGEGHPSLSDLDDILGAGARAAALTRQLLAFSRQQVLELRAVDLGEVVRGVERILRRTIGEDITLEVRVADEPSTVFADVGQLEQVLFNLAVNARDAMPDGGRLTIETGTTTLDGAYCESHPNVEAGRYVTLRVRDTGVGIDQETLHRIFEPFFTTKPKGKGTGLGLATVYGIIAQSEGHITVESSLGRGTTFLVYLPRHERPQAKGSTPPPAARLTGCETVLLVDDEETVRHVSASILRRYGYKVLEVRDVESAIRLCEAATPHVDLLLSDVVMPRMNGVDLAARLLCLRPQMRVLLMSGYARDASPRLNMQDRGLAFLPKPFSAQSFLVKVRQVLDERQIEQGPRADADEQHGTG